MQNVLVTMFPAEATLPDGRVVVRAKVWITDEGVIVWSEPVKEQAVHVFGARHLQPPQLPDMTQPKRRRVGVCTTDAGDVIVTGTTGCSCGMPALARMTFEDVQRTTRQG